MNVKERIAYVRGLIEGSEFYGQDTQVKNIWENLLRICDDLATELADVTENQEELEEYVEAIDSDLSELEGEVYDDDLDDEDDECDECDECAGHDADDEDEEEDQRIVEMECPKCGEDVTFDEGFLYDADVEISCPECGAIVYATGDAAPDGAAADGTAEGNEEKS